MRLRTLAGSLLIAASAATLFSMPMSADVTEDEAAIRQLWESYAASNVAGDAEAWLALWDENGLQMPPGRALRDKQTLVDSHPERLKAITYKAMSVQPEEIEVAGDWAYSRGHYSADLLNIAEGEEMHVEGKFMTILRKQPDGNWKIYRDIFNANPQ